MAEHKPCLGDCDRCYWYWHNACSEWLGAFRKLINKKDLKFSEKTIFKPLPRGTVGETVGTRIGASGGAE